MNNKLFLNDLAFVVLGLAAAYVGGVYILGFHPRLVISLFALVGLLYLPHIVGLVRHKLRPSNDGETENKSDDQGADSRKTMRDDFLIAAIGLLVALLVSVFFLGLDAMMTGVILFLVVVRYTPHLVKSYRAGQETEQR